MVGYFRTSGETNDLQLLPRALRDDEELEALAVRAEAEVLAYYTRSSEVAIEDATALDDGRTYVCLRGYTEDATDCEDARLARALRLEIADVMRWWWRRWGKEALLASDSKQGSGVSYRDDAESRLPPDLGAHLRPWDVRPVYTGL